MPRKRRKYSNRQPADLRAPNLAALKTVEAQGAEAFSETVGARLARTLDRKTPLASKLDRAYTDGYNEAWKNAKASYDGKLKQFEDERKHLKDSLLMTFQRLGDANAQMTMQFVKLLERA